MPVWSYEYNETGGYDCMTGAFEILKAGKRVAAIDQSDFGQEHCDYYKDKLAKDMAEFIVRVCNKMEQEA